MACEEAASLWKLVLRIHYGLHLRAQQLFMHPALNWTACRKSTHQVMPNMYLLRSHACIKSKMDGRTNEPTRRKISKWRIERTDNQSREHGINLYEGIIYWSSRCVNYENTRWFTLPTNFTMQMILPRRILLFINSSCGRQKGPSLEDSVE